MISDKYKKRLIPIKRDLMKEVISLLTNGRFDMAKETVIFYDSDSFTGQIPITFNYVEEKDGRIKLKKLGFEFANQITIEPNYNVNPAGEIMFLSRLLDYMELDRKDIRSNRNA